MRDVLQNGDSIRNLVTNLKAAAIISGLLVLPLVMLDFLFNPARRQNVIDPIVLFGLLWLLPMLFLVILIPLVRSLRAGTNILASPIRLLLTIASLVAIAWLWVLVLIDQLPCFIGVPNCD
jgi:hypothetical protein